jgi:hypothetical protein
MAEVTNKAIVEDTLRALAGAAVATRLYPAGSDMVLQAVRRFAETAATATADGNAVRVTIEPKGFRMGAAELAPGQPNLVTLAETLYAHQVGQVIITTGITDEEASEFVTHLRDDPATARAGGGLRAGLTGAGVTHIAVIELTLRTSTEHVDFTSAPLEEIGEHVAEAAERWAEGVGGGDGEDALSAAVDGLEDAARDLALERVAQALLRLDEASRVKVLSSALITNKEGRPMSGALSALTRMSPAALARLIVLASNDTARSIADISRNLELPPEATEALAILLAPAPREETQPGGPAGADPADVVQEALIGAPDDDEALRRYPAQAEPSAAAARALDTSLALARIRPDVDTVTSVGEALSRAVVAHSVPAAARGARLLKELGESSALGQAVAVVRERFADTPTLIATCSLPDNAAAPDDIAAILDFAGTKGAEALVAVFASADDFRRASLWPIANGMREQLLSAGPRLIRTEDRASALGVVWLLAAVKDRRAVAVMAKGLDHVDLAVRQACLNALADRGENDAIAAVERAINHWDPETRRLAARELGRVRAVRAVPTLVRLLQGYELYERNYELKKEVIKSLGEIGSQDAVPALAKLAKRRFVFGRKNRELQFLARQALEGMRTERGAT